MTEREEELAALNALHALDPHERQVLHLETRTDPRLRDLAAEFEDAAARIALLLPGEVPPEDVKPVLLKTLKQRRRAKPKPAVAAYRFLLMPRVAWAAAACLAAIALSGRSTIRHLSEKVAALSQGQSDAQGEAEAAKGTLAGLEKNLAEARNTADRLAGEIAALKEASPLARMEIVVLRATLRRLEESSAVVVWDGEKQEGRLRLERMPPAPANRDYQIWIIDRKTSVPVSAGVIRLEARGATLKRFRPAEPVAGPARFAISIEALGGAPTKPADTQVVFAGP